MESDRRFTWLWTRGLLIAFFLFLAALACSFPSLNSTETSLPPQPTETPLPTATPQPLPPVLVETDPLPGEKLAIDGEIKLYFNQAMDAASLEAALSSDPSLPADFEWEEADILIFRPRQQLDPEQPLRLTLANTAKAQNGLSLPEALTIEYETVSFLRVTQRIPENATQEVRADAAVIAAFNQPVIALGNESNAKAAFTVLTEDGQPVEGAGEWLNTSTYLFRAQPAFVGGKTYRVQFDPALKSLGGAPLQSPLTEWTFSVAYPRVLEISPSDGETNVRLDSQVRVTFSQPMEPSSVEQGFALFDSLGNVVQGEFEWNEEGTEVIFSPRPLLQRDQLYTLRLSAEIRAIGDVSLQTDTQVSWRTLPAFDLLGTDPANEGEKLPYESVRFYFSSPLADNNDLERYFHITPSVSNLSVWWDNQNWAAMVSADFDPSQDYTIEVSPDLTDAYGARLGRSVQISFRTAPLPPSLTLTVPSSVLYLSSRENGITAQAVNLPRLRLGGGSLSLDEFIRMQAADNYSLYRDFLAPDHQTWEQALELATNRYQNVAVELQPSGEPLSPGLYYIDIKQPSQPSFSSRYLIVVSDVHLTFKLSPQEVLVWAVESNSLAPLANAPITIYAENGAILAQGQTDDAGIFRNTIPTREDAWHNLYAVAYQPGHPMFGLAMPNWNSGVDSWEFDIPFQFSPPALKVYFYTDRPIYRPGQTVYFRAIARQAYNARYTLADISSLPVRVVNPNGQEITNLSLSLSEFGAGGGEFVLPEDAQPGSYSIESPLAEAQNVFFEVASYRKPQIELTFKVERDHLQAGENLVAHISARYFFDAPAGDIPIHWALYWQEESEYLPGYTSGEAERYWFNSRTTNLMLHQMGLLTNLVAEGEARTDATGNLDLSLPTEKTTQARRYLLEVTATDESGLPVSGRTSVFVHPASIIIGIKPDRWYGIVDTPIEAEVFVANWQAQPVRGKSLRAEFATIRWLRDETQRDLFGLPAYIPTTEVVGSADLISGDNGIARLSFTAQQAGTYLLSVAGEGARSSIILWVGGKDRAIFPNFPNQRIRLVTDRERYNANDTAKIFIPNPFPASAMALISYERSTVMGYEVRQIPPGGAEIEHHLTAEDVPTLYVSVTMLGRTEGEQLDFRQGYTQLSVAPTEQTLQVEATLQPERAGPGDEVSLEIQVKDSFGQAVQGEFSVAVVDKAIFSLAEPNAPSILAAFYGEQPLGVKTGIDLAVAARRLVELPGGLGGGGGAMPLSVVRQRFPDTAYWNGNLVTDSSGKATVNLSLPDNVTTWKILVRGVDQTTRVGETEIELVATKPLLIQPVTPRVWVAGDHLLLAALLVNNTSEDLQTQISLQSTAFLLDDGQYATQTILVPANGRKRVEWWGKVALQGAMEILLTAQAGELTDQVRIGGNDVQIQQATAKQTFSTAGSLDIAASRLEVVSLPKSVVPHAGSLKVELNSSLVGIVMGSLETFELADNQSTEYVLSRMLPNLAAYQLLKAMNGNTTIDPNELQRTIQDGIYQLIARQRFDGSWSWWDQGEGEPLITAYVLFGLSKAKDSGFTVSQDSLDRAIQYLLSGVILPQQTTDSATLDRLAFIHFALAQAGVSDIAALSQLYELRAQLNPWSEALLAWTWEATNPGSEQAQTLRADLAAQAIRSASGASWQEESPSWRMASYQLTVTAMTLYTLASYDPTTPLVADATRYLISNQRPGGGWGSSFATAWAYLALSEVIASSEERNGEFAFSASINGSPLVSGTADQNLMTTAIGEIPLDRLYRDAPNALEIQRQAGKGTLYYRALLETFVPIEGLKPIQRGFTISRAYRMLGESCTSKSCPAISSGKTGTRVEVRVTITIEKDAYYVLVKDYIPAGSEILDTRLLTTQLGVSEEELPKEEFDPTQPFKAGWGWQRFSQPMIYDDHLVWSAEYLPAGTYELHYILTLLQPGEYHLRPAEAWEIYFPEVQGISAGGLFTILP
ncbi:MAG: hypothetical protein Kow0088_16220 [Anaerolineales bacterium]